MPKSLGTANAPALASAPAVGVAGALYYNTGDSTLYKSNGAAWSAVGGAGGGTANLAVSDTAPGSPAANDMWWESDTGDLFIYYDSTWVEIGGGPPGPIGQSVQPWTKTGTIAVATGSLRFPLPFDGAILGVTARVGTAPTGAAILVDVNKNGTTIFTNQANRPTIAISQFTSGEVTNMDVTTFAAGDYLTIDIDQIGSTIAGSDLTVVVRYRDAYGASSYNPAIQTFNAQSGTAYTPNLDDIGKMIELNNASPITVTVPLNSTAPFPIGTRLDFLQTGAGQATFSPTGGVTLNYNAGNKLIGQWAAASLTKRATDTWVLIGNLVP